MLCESRVCIIVSEYDALCARGLDIVKTASERDSTRAAGTDVADRDVPGTRRDSSHRDISRFIVDINIANRDVAGTRHDAFYGYVTRLYVDIVNDTVSITITTSHPDVSNAGLGTP